MGLERTHSLPGTVLTIPAAESRQRSKRAGSESATADSRSFRSHPRHEYFRRVLCNLIGNEIEAGELPDDEELVGGMIRNICYDNAARLLELPIPEQSGIPVTTTR